MVLPDMLVRGRWAVDASGRPYIQGDSQLLLSLSLPPEIAIPTAIFSHNPKYQMDRLHLRNLFLHYRFEQF